MSTSHSSATSPSRIPLQFDELLALLQAEGTEAYSPFIDTRIMPGDDFEIYARLNADQLSVEVAMNLLSSLRTASFLNAFAHSAQLDPADLLSDISRLHQHYQAIYASDRAREVQEQINDLQKQLGEYKAILAALPSGTHRLGRGDVQVTYPTSVEESVLQRLLGDEKLKELTYESKFSPTLARANVPKNILDQALKPAEKPSITIKTQAKK